MQFFLKNRTEQNNRSNRANIYNCSILSITQSKKKNEERMA